LVFDVLHQDLPLTRSIRDYRLRSTGGNWIFDANAYGHCVTLPTYRKDNNYNAVQSAINKDLCAYVRFDNERVMNYVSSEFFIYSSTSEATPHRNQDLAGQRDLCVYWRVGGLSLCRVDGMMKDMVSEVASTYIR
jgi:hypothetical protein